jgi:hypothetical protein
VEPQLSKWTFFGKVQPERIPVTWNTPLCGHARQSDLDIEFDFRTVIHASQIIVDITVTKGTPDLDTLRHTARGCALPITDLVGYTSATHFEAEITSAVCHDNDEWRVFGNEIPALVARNNSHRGNTIDGTLVQTVGRNVAAQMVLRDFQRSMRDAIETGFYCYRAVESMMQSMRNTSDDNKAWEQFRSALSLDKSALFKIKSHADLPRHGNPSSMTDADRASVFELTDEIIRRYLEYLRRVAGPLSVTEFPILKWP